MKRKISIVMIVTLILATVFSVNGFAATSTKTEALLDKVSNSKKIAVTMTTGSAVLGTTTDTYYINGDAAAYDHSMGFTNLRVVIRDGKAYAYFPILPFFYAQMDTGLINVDVSKIIKSSVGLTKGITHFEKSYDETLDGKTYYVEQFNDGATVTLKFYYDGDDLKLLSVYDASTKSTQNTYFEKITFDVDDSVTAAPKGLDITPFIQAFIIGMIGSALV